VSLQIRQEVCFFSQAMTVTELTRVVSATKTNMHHQLIHITSTQLSCNNTTMIIKAV